MTEPEEKLQIVHLIRDAEFGTILKTQEITELKNYTSTVAYQVKSPPAILACHIGAS